MKPIQLISELSVGHPDIDGQHGALVGLANEVLEAIEAGRPKSDIATRIGALIASTQAHFLSEESFMLTSGFDQHEAHRSDHVRLLEQLQVLRQKIESGVILPSEFTDFFVRSWISHHIVKFDLGLAEHLRSVSRVD